MERVKGDGEMKREDGSLDVESKMSVSRESE